MASSGPALSGVDADEGERTDGEGPVFSGDRSPSTRCRSVAHGYIRNRLRTSRASHPPLSRLRHSRGFPRPALPGVFGRTDLSATLTARPVPHGIPVGACTPPTGLPVLRPSPSCMRAAATTPAEPASALVARFPADGSLPRFTGGSASALPVSRPAQRSPKLRPACSLNRPWRPFSSECFRRGRYLLRPLRLLPAGATVAGRDSHPLRDGAFARRTVKLG